MNERDWLKLRSGPMGFISGVYAVFWGLGRIRRDPAMVKLAALPVAFTSVFYAGVLAAVVYFSGDILSWIWEHPDGGIEEVIWYLLIPFVILALLVPFALLFMTIAEMIGGPFYDKIAMRLLEEHGIRTQQPGLIKGTLPDLFRSLLFTIVALFCGALALIPALGIPFGVAGAGVAWLGFAAASINPSLMSTGHGLSDRLGFTFRHVFVMLGVGAVIWCALFLPFLGLVAIPAAVAGATELYAKSRDQRANNS